MRLLDFYWTYAVSDREDRGQYHDGCRVFVRVLGDTLGKY